MNDERFLKEYLREEREQVEDFNRQTKRPNVHHYLQGGIEPIDFINSHNMNFNLGNAIKYITRCNHKGTKEQDLKKAIDYLNFELEKCND